MGGQKEESLVLGGRTAAGCQAALSMAVRETNGCKNSEELLKLCDTKPL